MKVAMLGTRGVPAAYGGFETCVEAVGKRLVARGHSVTIYCRRDAGGAPDIYFGIKRVTLPALQTKGLETLTRTLLSSVHSIVRERPDAALVFGVGNAILCSVLRAGGIPTAINVDGPDWSRKKWGGIGRRYLRWSEGLAGRTSTVVIADSQAVVRYYRDSYHTTTVMIPYGADIPELTGRSTLAKFGLQPRGYLLAVGRLVPENGFHDLIQAYAETQTRMPFVIVGDATYSEDYKRRLKEMAPPGVIFTGYQFGDAYHELSRNAYAFLFAAEVGGTHPVLVEQLAHGNCIVARATDSNSEVFQESALQFSDNRQLCDRLTLVLKDEALVERMRTRAKQRAQAYSWDRVTDQYEEVLKGLVRQPATVLSD